MLKRRAIPVVIILAILLVPVLIVAVLPEPVPVSTSEPFQSERSKRMEGSYGHPDLFAAYHAAIRTAPDGTTYPSNYRMAAFNEAIAARKNAGNQLPWIERGPGNVPGRTRTLVVDPDDPSHGTWFVGSIGGGVWKTNDEGRTWRSLTDHLPNLAVSALVMANSDRDILYMGTGEGFFNVGSVAGSGIFKSVDRGETWTQLQSTATLKDFQYVNRLAVDPDNADVVLAATNGGIYRSEDGGDTWTEVYGTSLGSAGFIFEPGRMQDLQANPDDFNIQFATVNGTSVLRSLDAGQTWEVSLDEFIFVPGRMELAIAPSNTNVVYVAIEVSRSSGSALYRTMDGGETWNPILNSQSEGNLGHWMGDQGWYNNTIAVHPFSPDTVYLGGIDLWRSVPAEGGESREIGIPTEFNGVGTEDFITFVRFSAGYFGSTLRTGPDDDEVVDVTEDELVSVDIRFGPGRSQKAHRFTISPTGGPEGDGGGNIFFADYMFADYVDVPFEVWDVTNNRQLMVSFRDQADDGVYDLIARSLNRGSNWREMSREYIFVHKYSYDATAPMPAISADGGLVNGQLYWIWPILPSNGTWDPEELPESELQIVISEVVASLYDITLLDVSGNPPHVDHHSLTLIPINEATGEFRIINTNDGGVYLSKDSGRRWFGIGRGYNTAQFYGVDKRPGVDVYLGGTQDNGTWRSFGVPPGTEPDPNRGWLKQFGNDGFATVWHSENDKLLMLSAQYNNIWRSTDGGNNWGPAQSGLSDTESGGSAPFVTALGNSKARPDVVFTVGASGVWRSDDFGANWQGIPIPSNRWESSSLLGRVRVSLANPDVVWAGFRFSETGARIHVSRDGGTSFEPISMPAAAPNRTLLSGMATHPHEEGTAYMLYGAPGRAKILRTTDFGETWDDLSGFGTLGSTRGFPDVAVYDLLVMPHNPDIMWAGTEIGLFVTEDGADSWEYSDNGFPAASIWQIRLIDDQIVVATHGRGVWTVDVDLVVATEEGATELPTSFVLEQNYPNPFNAGTTISFETPEPMHVTLTVFDVAGRKVATLVDQAYQAGAHRLNWDARGYSSGTYFYRMEAGSTVQTQRMVLVK